MGKIIKLRRYSSDVANEWTLVGFGIADGDEYHTHSVVLARFDTAEAAIAALIDDNTINTLSADYETAGGDVFFLEWGVLHNGVDITWN